MTNGFTLHDKASAPAASTEILNSVRKSWRLVPNLHRVLAEREDEVHGAATQHRLHRYYLGERVRFG
jgi:hypothetical protein